MGKIIEFKEQVLRDELGELVRGTVEDTLNSLLDAEAKDLCKAGPYERAEERQGYRAGHYSRNLSTKAGDVKINMPKLKGLKFETSIIERYRRRESSVEEALIEMYLAGVSVRRVEDITEALWGTKVSPGTISDLNKKAYVNIEKWRNRPITNYYPYVFVDGIVLKRCWAGSVRNVSVLVAIGVNEFGYREILGAAEGEKEDKEGWLGFLRWLKEKGLQTPKLFTSDVCIGLVDSLGEVYPGASWQRCTVHFYRNVFSSVPNKLMKEVAAMLKAIHAQEDLESAQQKAGLVVEKLKKLKLTKAANLVAEKIHETFTYMDFPMEHWCRIRTNNMLERLNREIRRRTRVVGNFPDGNSALMLVSARLRHIAGTAWSTKRYLNMEHLYKAEIENKTKVA